MPKSLQYMTFDRDQIDDVICIYPVGHEKHPEGREVTKREEINEKIEQFGHWFGRRDLAMLNLWDDDDKNSCHQMVAEPTSAGKPHYDPGMKALLSKSDIAELEQMNEKLVLLEKKEGWPAGTLTTKHLQPN